MRILVTGSTGFVGQHVIPVFLEQGHEIIATSRSREKAKTFDWYSKVNFIEQDLYKEIEKPYRYFLKPDMLVHLAWNGLPNYRELFHFEENLFYDYHLIKKMVTEGLRHVLVTGTCLEYGMQNGCLHEGMETKPENPYALAKDMLRKMLFELEKKSPFILQWVRLFYVFGKGQNPKSLIAQLDKAIDNGDEMFNMSFGDQLRDYLPVMDVAKNIVSIALQEQITGIINCCSAKPISVRSLVEKRIREVNAKITLNIGYYPYPDYEPMAFWGDNSKLLLALKANATR